MRYSFFSPLSPPIISHPPVIPRCRLTPALFEFSRSELLPPPPFVFPPNGFYVLMSEFLFYVTVLLSNLFVPVKSAPRPFSLISCVLKYNYWVSYFLFPPPLSQPCERLYTPYLNYPLSPRMFMTPNHFLYSFVPEGWQSQPTINSLLDPRLKYDSPRSLSGVFFPSFSNTWFLPPLMFTFLFFMSS